MLSQDGESALTKAVAGGDFDIVERMNMVKLLLKRGANKEAKTGRSY